MLVMLVAVLVSPVFADLSFSFGSRLAALVVQDTPFPPAVQLLSGLGAGMSAGGPQLTADLSLDVAYAPDRLPVEGSVYRGIVLRTIGLGASWTPVAGLGIRASGVLALAGYRATRLLFFFPGVELAPMLTHRIGRWTRLEWSLPVSYHFRRDMRIAAAVGIQARITARLEHP